MKKSETEQTKLLATAFNTAGLDTALAGLVVPLVTYPCDIPSAPTAACLVLEDLGS